MRGHWPTLLWCSPGRWLQCPPGMTAVLPVGERGHNQLFQSLILAITINSMPRSTTLSSMKMKHQPGPTVAHYCLTVPEFRYFFFFPFFFGFTTWKRHKFPHSSTIQSLISLTKNNYKILLLFKTIYGSLNLPKKTKLFFTLLPFLQLYAKNWN